MYLTLSDCGGVTKPVFGQVSVVSQTSYGHNATFSCNTGYSLQGSEIRACGSNGQWSGTQPTCTFTGSNAMFKQLYVHWHSILFVTNGPLSIFNEF